MGANEEAPLQPVEILETGDTLGECPLWDGRLGVLYWLDIHGERIGRWEIDSGKWDAWPTGRRLGSIALTSLPGRLLVAGQDGLWIADVDDDGFRNREFLTDPETDRPGNRFNDGRTDRAGRFWTGTMDDAETERRGSLYRLDEDRALTSHRHGMGVPNSICFSPAGDVMYVADSWERRIERAPYDPEAGRPGPFAPFAAVETGGAPDGSVVDAAGMLWNAEWGSGRLTRYRSDGRIDQVIETPAPRPTCPAFGGADLHLLFATTARKGGNPPGPRCGTILVYEPGVTGLAETPFPAP